MGPIFIVGMPRSGTKMLREILNNHKDISIPRAETGFIPYFYSKFKQSFLDTEDNLAKIKIFHDELIKTSFYYHMENSEDIWGLNAFAKHDRECTIESLIRSIFELHSLYENKLYWGDKTPEYIHQINLIKHLFPDAKIIHIVRDCRDYCLSTRKAWNKNIYRAAQKWVDGIGKFHSDSSAYPGDIHEIKYENLLDSPETEIRALCNWLGISYDSNILGVGKNTENLGDAKNINGILRGNFGKWKTELTNNEINKVEKISCQLLAQLDYELSSKCNNTPLNKFENIFYSIQDIYNIFKFRVDEYGNIYHATKRMLHDFKMKFMAKILSKKV